MLSRTALYALRAAVTLARAEDEWTPASELADSLGVPSNYLSKTLHRLGRHGVLRSRRGPNGGFRLARPASETSVAEVVELFDTVHTGTQCIIRPGPCDPDDPCDAHADWAALRDATASVSERMTIADLAGMHTPPTTGAGAAEPPARAEPPGSDNELPHGA